MMAFPEMTIEGAGWWARPEEWGAGSGLKRISGTDGGLCRLPVLLHLKEGGFKGHFSFRSEPSLNRVEALCELFAGLSKAGFRIEIVLPPRAIAVYLSPRFTPSDDAASGDRGLVCRLQRLIP